MLRASIEYEGTDAQLGGISGGSKAGDAGIEHGERLTAFADAAVAAANSLNNTPDTTPGDTAEIATLDAARDALREAAGSAIVVDAAGVIGNFERMVRIADGTGIPLDGLVEVMSDDFREELGLEAFQSRRTTQPSLLRRTFGPLMRGAIRTGLRVAGRRAH